eukprot:CAMPEP_0197642258 /NCGR_PEP_ID=MMETSP1338-20131121/15972_1 /TAXON_ID=43686 ORGANISM="Pelagodinium beii, Strain RCC1491" /NCGR_SAMPLE_ID=MMETSP1338 /ASSEMBLY_ACC=CAM_ASM_000754 /LENGTH=183 /DNA_ID=CAMNT_0043215355 /DNA_START=15 /DNA_END=566 /DNA_ORIENTATION=+
MRHVSTVALEIYDPDGCHIYVKNTFLSVTTPPQLSCLRSSSSAPALLSFVAMKEELAKDSLSCCGTDDMDPKSPAADLSCCTYNDEASSDNQSVHDQAVTSDNEKIHMADSNMLELHALGKCSPCAYTVKADGCRHRDACKFCHLHSKEETLWWFKTGKKALKRTYAQKESARGKTSTRGRER